MTKRPWRGVALLTLALLPAGCGIVGLSDKEEIAKTLHIQQARGYYVGQRYDAAEQQARKALEYQAKNDVANLILGWSLLQQRNTFKLTEALSTFEDMIERGNVNFRTYYGLALTRYRTGVAEISRSDQLERWLTNLPAREKAAAKAGISVPNDEELKVMISDARTESKRHITEAIEDLEAVLEINPSYPQALLTLGQIYLLQKKDAAALENFLEYLRLAEATREQGLKPEDWIQANMAENERNSIYAAIEKAVKGNIEKDISVRLEVARILFVQEDYEGAISHLDKAIELDPESRTPYLNRGECYGKLEKYNAAIRDLEVFVKRSDRKYDGVMSKAARLLVEYTELAGQSPKDSPLPKAQ